MNDVSILPSVSLREDLASPERLAHYRPTTRTVPVIGAVLGSGATMVIAAYGSGKSLAAGVAALAVDNDPANRALLRDMAESICYVDPDVATEYLERVSLAQRGKVLALSGRVDDVPAAIAEALGLPAGGGIDDVLGAIKRTSRHDHVAIIWDEFGRHLEGLAREGRTAELDLVQRLAEFAQRARKPTVSLTLLMHRNILAYAGALNQASRGEWRKVEGRFRQIRFVEDSREIYALLAETISARRSASVIPAPRSVVEDAITHRWLDGLSDPRKVTQLLASAAPVSAAALHVLPGLAARVGQNQRSLFSFLDTADLTRPVGLLEVHAAFSEEMRADVGPGGVHRRWVEAQSALSRADDEIEREVLAGAFLLQLGLSGERRRLTRGALEAAARSKGYDGAAVTAAAEALVERKLLLHRKLTDDVSVWHGADIDIARRLDEERARRSEGFDVDAFLAERHPAPFIRAVRHNMRTGTSRYVAGQYALSGGLAALDPKPGRDVRGRVIFVLCGNDEEIRDARRHAASSSAERTIFVIPNDPVPAADAALEIEALCALRRDDDLLSEDPLVAQELDELLSVARRQLSVILHRLTSERGLNASWWSSGRDLLVGADRPAGVAVSNLMDEWFPATPRIANDQLMRETISTQMRTYRVRTVLRLMERSTTPALGYDEDGSAEASVYRTVLARTGLHVPDAVGARFCDPTEVSDPAMAAVWSAVRDFFTRPGRKRLADIVDLLAGPPHGLPSGVIPIIVMAGYKAFARAVTIRTDGTFVADVLGFASTKMFLEPDRHEIEVHTANGETLRYLENLTVLFGQPRPGLHDERLRCAANSILAWRSGIADGALRSRRMPDAARRLLRSIAEAIDPAVLILDVLPSEIGGGNLERTLDEIETLRNAIDGLVKGYLRDAVEVIFDVLRLDGAKGGPEALRIWTGCFDVDALMRRPDLRMTDKAILRTVREVVGGKGSPETLARAASSILLQRGLEKWQDDTRALLGKELKECRDRIEAATLASESLPESFEPILDARIRWLQDRLTELRKARGEA